MGTVLIWKINQLNRSETRHSVHDLADLIDLVRAELSDRAVYVEARDGKGSALESHLRVSPDDLTDEDFTWLTAPVTSEVRGVRA